MWTPPTPNPPSNSTTIPAFLSPFSSQPSSHISQAWKLLNHNAFTLLVSGESGDGGGGGEKENCYTFLRKTEIWGGGSIHFNFNDMASVAVKYQR